MPTLLSPPASDLTEDISTDESARSAVLPSDSSVRGDETQRRRVLRRAMPGRRTAGFVCVALAALLAVFVGGSSLTLAYQVGDAAHATALIAISDLAHHVLPRSPDTASVGSNPADPKDGCVPGDRSAWNQNVLIDSTAWLCGSVTVYGGSVTIIGQVDGDVRAIGGSIDISGQVGGNVTSIGGNVDLHSGARVGGNIQALLGGGVNQEYNARVQGKVTTDGDLQRFGPDRSPLTSGNVPWVQLLFWVLAAAALTLLVPDRVQRVRAMAEEHLAKSFASGMLALILGLVMMLVLILTIIGIPLAVLLLGALWIAWVVGTVALGSWLGESLLHMVWRGRLAPAVSAVPGVCLIAGLTAVPYVGWAVFFVTGIGGMGASLRTLLATRQAKRDQRRGR